MRLRSSTCKFYAVRFVHVAQTPQWLIEHLDLLLDRPLEEKDIEVIENHQRRAMPQGALPIVKAEALQPDAPLQAWTGGPDDIAKPRYLCHQCSKPVSAAGTLCRECHTEAEKEKTKKAENAIVISGVTSAVVGAICMDVPMISVGAAALLGYIIGQDVKKLLPS